MLNPLISVIIPAHNTEKYIGDCIKSVLSQSFNNFELIIVDDGSTDYSNKICNEAAKDDERIIVISCKNGGASSARNIGYEIANGDYIYYFDSDDLLNTNALQILVEAATNEKLDIVVFDAKCISANGQVIADNKSYMRKKKYVTSCGTTMLSDMMQNKDYHVAPWMYFFSKEYMSKNNLSFMTGIMCEDELFAFQAMKNADSIVHINEPLYFHRMHSNSIMSRNQSSTYRFISLCKILFALEESKDELDQEDRLYQEYQARIAKSALYSYQHLSDSDKKLIGDAWEKLKNIIELNNAFNDLDLKYRTKNWYVGMAYSAFKKVLR